MLGTPRFVFHDVLTGGVAIVPALIGLFAIPQVFSLMEGIGKTSAADKVEFTPEKGILLKTIVENLKMVKALGIGSVVGSIIGVIPGAGGQVSGLIAYDQVRKFSGHPEKFGSGNPEGVVAAESANNAMVGPSLIPLLTLSVPGSPTAAVLLGGLLIHGLFPGPDLFRTHATRRGDLYLHSESGPGPSVHVCVWDTALALFVQRHAGAQPSNDRGRDHFGSFRHVQCPEQL
jgi:putative tricarboxylic transport membrane protein